MSNQGLVWVNKPRGSRRISRGVQATLLPVVFVLLVACGSGEVGGDGVESKPTPSNPTLSNVTPAEEEAAEEPESERPQNLPTISLVNGSSLDDQVLMGWAELAEQQMQSRASNILMFVYDVGKPIEPPREIPDTEAREHEMLLNVEQVDALMAEFGAWLESDDCMSQDAEYRADEVELYRRYLERGGDASHMRALCPQTRVVGVGLTDSLRNLEPASETELFVLHELYHAFQQDLEEDLAKKLMVSITIPLCLSGLEQEIK